ncbi:hypothetical protein FZC66_14825 [Priestia megaterium]|nr:hypothetical protein FZC66_14825 [Priestia megaterium]
MEKYQLALLTNIRKQLQQWFEEDNDGEKSEILRFLHSLAGTSATIGLNYLGEVARHLMEKVEAESKQMWNTQEIKTLLIDIITICYQDEIAEITEFEQEFTQKEEGETFKEHSH